MKYAHKILGSLGLFLMSAGIASAQTGTSTGTTTPGVPNTGAGGDAALYAMILFAASAAIIAGILYMYRTDTS